MPKTTFFCEECRKEYQKYASQKPRFCSLVCKGAWMKREVAPKHKAPWLTALNQTPGRNAAIAKAFAKQHGDDLRGTGAGKSYTK